MTALPTITPVGDRMPASRASATAAAAVTNASDNAAYVVACPATRPNVAGVAVMRVEKLVVHATSRESFLGTDIAGPPVLRDVRNAIPLRPPAAFASARPAASGTCFRNE